MTYDQAKDSRDSYDLAIEAWRELAVREWRWPPELPHEARWRAEGQKPIPELDTVRLK